MESTNPVKPVRAPQAVLTQTPIAPQPYDVPLWAQQLQWRLDQIQAQLYRIEQLLNPK